MADLLECLLQIKGLRETVSRVMLVRSRAIEHAGSASSELQDATRRRLESLLAAEREWHEFFRETLPRERTATLRSPQPESRSVVDLAEAFVAARLSTVSALDDCNATELSTVGRTAARPRLTVADAVAAMLAEDTDVVGRIVSSIGLSEV
ncbi:MAG: hypothetical protein ACE148_10115 [Vicinamibacterales bacterium]